LKDILGDDVTQAGSWVGIDRMRFDFRTPSGALSPHQQRAVTERVNQFIREDHHLTTRVLPLDEAKQTGALTMAGEQYADPVRVVQAGPSTEFCGGTHSVSTGELGIFIIISESSIGSGVRRIEAVVSKAAEKYVLDQLELVDSVAESLSAKPQEIGARIDRMQHELRDVEKSRADIRTRMAEKKAERYVERAEQVNGVRFVGGTLSGTDVESLRQIAQAARSKVGEGVVAFAGTEDDSVSLIVLVSDGTTKRGLHAGVLLKAALPPIEGRGGGNATLAQGGGKKTDGAGAAIDAIRQALAS
ncbi:MAG: DHHA1 domain-containing protein, partial [Vulcanimicrobiaceae bacterium]